MSIETNIIEAWTPNLPFAIVAYDANGVIGFGDEMAYDPQQDLLTDNRHMWAVLTNPEQPVSLIGGRVTLLPLLNIIPDQIDDIIVVSRNKRLLERQKLLNPERVRLANTPEDAMAMARHTPAVFGGESIYAALQKRLWYVMATEIDTVFANVRNKPVKTFPRLTDQFIVRSNEAMPRGEHDKFNARFVVWERQ